MTSFTDSEKVEYALKTTLNITMSKFGYAPFNETPAPPRVFPSNVMSKDLIKYGDGDVDENGAYVSGHSQSGNIDTTLTTYESVLKYYKIVCPFTNKVSAAQLKDVLGSTSIQNVLGRDITSVEFSYAGGGGSATASNFWTKPVKNNFHTLAYFRGHYLDEDNMTSKFNYANSNYNGLNLAWNHIAAGTDVSAAIDADGNGTDDTKIVPHLKLFLQVQTAFQIGAANKENQCFGHTMMKNMLGLDFKIPVQVNVGEVSGDPNVTATALSDITGPGVAAGNEWYTQSTAGTINFYAVGHTVTAVDNARSPTDNPIDSSAPLVTFLKYTGDHAGVGGLGGGGGSGSAFEPDMGAVRFKSGEILYDFTEHTFTTGGNTGRYGPQLQTVINAYSSTTWVSNYFGTNGAGIQKWTIPETATYTITAYGADAVNSKGGKGVIITGDFLLKKGEVIEILCGQRVSPYDTNNHCGAGGSFVVRAPYNTVDSILVIAGGGGGAHNLSGTLTDDNIDKHGQPGTKAGSGTSYGTAFHSGNNNQYDPNGGRHGGGGGLPSTGDTNTPGVHGGAGGGGFLTNGESGVSSNIGGVSYVNGGTGGNVSSSYYGGFGAGGSHGASHGGGGGGYTGGGGGRDNPHIGGGGGSYNSGTNKVALWGDTDGWVGEGKVYIVKKTTVNYNNFTLNNRPIATGAAPLYDFDIHTFTPCKKTGKTGPTFDQCKDEYEPYWVTQSSHFDVTNGVQKWTVPESGTYKITACGAAGGYGGQGNIARVGGKGALLSGEFDLTKGKIINIVVGQMGQTEPTYSHAPGGGGGGTFITQEPHNTIESILIVAGGGSGAGQGNNYSQNVGAGGHGRDAQTIEGYSDGRAGTVNGSWSCAGAGFTANGPPATGGTHPYGYTNQLASSNILKGGDSTSHGDDSDGGFGGGGFGNLGPGGGGGFCGGNVETTWAASAESYGGTSKMSDAARNTTFGHDTRDYRQDLYQTQPFSDEEVDVMLNTRPGYVIIEKLIAIAEIEGGIDGLTSDNGNIGIGTTSPDNLLHLKGSYPIQVEHSTNSTLKLFIDYNQIHTEGNNNLYLNYNSQKHILMCGQGGNVGIGSATTPNYKLSLGTSEGAIAVYENAGNYFYGFKAADVNGWGLNFYTSSGDDTNSNIRMCIKRDNGKVGIGTTDPKERLDVGNGKICFSGNLHSGTEGGISYYHSGQSIERKILFFDANGSTYIRSCDNSPSDGIKFQNYDGSTRMFIQDNGYVGIGHDPSYMLDVNGSARFANCIWTQNSANYGSVVLTGEKDGGYWGIQLGDSSNQPKIMSSGSNIGFYFDGTNEWGFYCDVNAGSYIYYNGGCKLRTKSNGVTVNGELFVDNWIRPSGGHGLYFESYGGGWYMVDTTWIRSYNSKPVYIDNWMCAEHVQCNSTSRSGNYVLRAHASHSIGFYTESYLGTSGASNTSTTYTETASAWFSGDIHVTSEVFVASDRRTKKDIEDVPDHNALEIVRNIPCRYYNYVDPQRNSENKSIGFIAQEVLPILPTAITIKNDFLPNRLEFIEMEEWIDIDESDITHNNYKLKSNLTDVSGVCHRFICEDISNNKEIILEEVGNEDGTFNFPSKFDKIFCYGTEVDDFHVLDKSKIFALYHSCIQEIDRLQQADKAKIAELENKVVTIESELATIKQHLGI